jgi:Cof subfamily protein (haloacid dehalogenase superfamily)
MKKNRVSDNDLKNVRMIILDMDGTLLNKKGQVSDNIVKLIHTLKKIGIFVTLASARVHSSMVKFAELLEIDIPIISLDGALIKNREGDVVIHQAIIKPAVVRKTIKLAEQYLVQIGLCHQDEIFYNEDSSSLPMILEKAGAKYTEVKSFDNHILNNTLEIVCTGDNKKSLELISRKLKFPFAFGNSVNIYRSRLYPAIHYLECKKSGSSKANAFYKLIRYLKVKEKNTLVAGDWYNDIPMFKTKAIKVALKNSIPRLKMRADIILKRTNDEDGLQEIFEKIIFLKS